MPSKRIARVGTGSRNGLALLLCCALIACSGVSVDAFSFNSWMNGDTRTPRSPSGSESESNALSSTEEADIALSPEQPRKPAGVCHGSGDKEPFEHSCAEQVSWGKCNETWLIEGGYCMEGCGMCQGRIPVQLASSDDRNFTTNSMPDPGSKSCKHHIAYEWRIRTDRVKEASGLTASRLNKNILWSHVDGYSDKVLAFLSDTVINTDGDFGLQGQPIAEVRLPSWVNKNPKSGRVDWEDIAVAQCPDQSGRQCLWISDTGNNKFNRRYSNVIVVVEPTIDHMIADPERPMNTEYFTPNEVDKRNKAGICQHGTHGDECQHNSCKSDDANLRKDLKVANEDTWVFTFKFPGTKEKDSEALAVAPDGSRFWLFEKNEEDSGANIYESDLLHYFDYSKNEFIRVDLFAIGLIRPPCVAAGTDCLEWGEDHFFSITGADVHPSGKSVALQTYRGPFVYEFDPDKPFDISAMQRITPRDVLGNGGWGAEAIAFSPSGDRLWQMPEENKHSGCQKVLTMDCGQPVIDMTPQDPVLEEDKEGIEIREKANDEDLSNLARNIERSVREDQKGPIKEKEDDKQMPASDVEQVGNEISLEPEAATPPPPASDPNPSAVVPMTPEVCEVVPNGWGTEKNASIPICDTIDAVPRTDNSTEVFSCEEQASWGKCEEPWMVNGGFCRGACGRCTHTTCTRSKKWEKTMSPLLCNAATVSQDTTANVSKLIIFDFDDTVKLHHPARPAPEALWAIEETVRLGYGIAIASASCHTDYLRSFLMDLTGDVFTPEFVFSNAFQTCQKKKTGALQCTLAHYGLLDKPECAVFFDDSISNGQYADEANIKMIEVQKGVGVTRSKFQQGLDYLNQVCSPSQTEIGRSSSGGDSGDVTVIKDYKGCTDKAPADGYTCAEQAAWGKCDEAWIVDGGFCTKSCGRCEAGEASVQSVG